MLLEELAVEGDVDDRVETLEVDVDGAARAARSGGVEAAPVDPIAFRHPPAGVRAARLQDAAVKQAGVEEDLLHDRRRAGRDPAARGAELLARDRGDRGAVDGLASAGVANPPPFAQRNSLQAGISSGVRGPDRSPWAQARRSVKGAPWGCDELRHRLAPAGRCGIRSVPEMKTYFPDDCYETLADTPISIWSRLFGRCRWVFYVPYAGVVLKARSIAVRGAYDDDAWAVSSISVLRLIERHRGRFDVRGLDQLRNAASRGPFVFIANHMSTLETQVLPVLIVPFMPVTFVVKEKLVSGNMFGPVMRSRDPITVGRKNPREDLDAVLNGGAERLGRGISIIVFPQSTRSPVFRPEGFNTLGVKLAAKAAVPAIPVAIKSDFWGEEGLFRGFGPIRPERTVHIEFGAPITVEGRGKEQHLQIVDFIQSRLASWGQGPSAG